ncbi:hypothetical protein GYMLUDRAFT_32363 [Collybiopsis luxurians FD-317 M1]|nr:hypothetical protein GYMLUDRAFT_32363 [Collybiopsis luxurians FD-317 M1]
MPQTQHATLCAASSLTLNGASNCPTGARTKETRSVSGTIASGQDSEVEIVPDSEEERIRRSNSEASRIGRENEVIEISSDEEDTNDDDLFIAMPGSWSVRPEVVASVVAAPQSSTSSKTAKISTKYRVSRRVIESSESEDEHTGVKKLETAPRPFSQLSFKPQNVFRSPKLSLYTDSDSDSEAQPLHDEAFLIMNDPPQRKRKPKLPLLSNDKGESASASIPSTPSGRISASVNLAVNVRLTPSSAGRMSATKRQPRTGKKAEAEAKLERLKKYAEDRFAYLNEKVFDSKIPTTTVLLWNPRFRTTAGKATYKRDRHGSVLSQIELGTKILDEEERIDRTLSHEMCHLASWIISAKIDENHGQIFKAWAAKVEKDCPGIVVSTTHDYEIRHPFHWKCNFCTYTVGRFSKSIATGAECEACLKGQLVPQFEQATRRDPDTPKSSRMAASKPRDSPSALVRNSSPTKSSSSGSSEREIEVICIHDSDSEPQPDPGFASDDSIEIIATKIAATTIS